MLFKDISILALVGIQRSRMVCAILVEGIMRNISVNFFQILVSRSGDVVKVLFLALVAILFSGAKPFVKVS